MNAEHISRFLTIGLGTSFFLVSFLSANNRSPSADGGLWKCVAACAGTDTTNWQLMINAICFTGLRVKILYVLLEFKKFRLECDVSIVNTYNLLLPLFFCVFYNF